jgi:hypothetical protein
MIGNKEELLAAKVCSITKWLLTKTLAVNRYEAAFDNYDCVLACNATLQTLTGHKLKDLMLYCPDETGGEILHRIPNMRFSTMTYIRSEMNKSLGFTNELNQYSINERQLVDSNINFDYLRLRLTLAMMIKDDFLETTSVITRYDFSNLRNIHDVQFVTPHLIDDVGGFDIVPYAKFRKHVFSDLRFRFMAASYLTAEDITDLALLPNADIINDLDKFGESIVGEIIYKYSRALDSEYMTMLSTYPRDDIWLPLYPKLEVIMPGFKDLSMREKKEKVIDILETELITRLRITLKSNIDKSQVLLQNEIIARIHEDHPNDQIYSSLTMKYLQVRNISNQKDNIEVRISEYNKFLGTKNQYTDILSRSLIAEIITTLHFKTRTDLGVLMMDVRESATSYEEIGSMMSILQEVSPELYIRCMILGNPTLKEFYSKNKASIYSYLYEISTDIISYDVEVPTLSMSTKQVTLLSDTWEMPDSAYSIDYHLEPITSTSMKSLDDLGPMLKYIERVCDFSANPAVLNSPTGSDSCQAQFALFRLLMREFGIDKNTRICDLTAGRGDGQYALKALGLIGDSYSRPDVFTSVMYHPSIIFSNDYDIFKTETLQFCLDYDFIHVDVSFLGRDDPDISDCILLLESQSLPYCVRLNSINVKKYAISCDELDIAYDHYIAHSISSHWRPYQVYLIGIPGRKVNDNKDLVMRNSPAFRSMALSYTAMVKGGFTNQYSIDQELNSVTICLPNQASISDLLIYVSDKCVLDERNYYLDRFMTEFLGSNTIYISRTNVPLAVDNELMRLRGSYKEITGKIYQDYTIDDIGKTSTASIPHHQRHISSFHDEKIPKVCISLNRESVIIMNLLRRHHPLYDMRKLCNILLGIARMCPEIEEYSLENVKNARKKGMNMKLVKQTKQQKDLTEALKLHIVSVAQNDELLPLRYCTLMGMEYTSKKKYYERIRKNVKMMSGFRTLIRQNILNGYIRMSAVETIGDELFIRKCMNYEQARKYSNSDRAKPGGEEPMMNIDLNLDELFLSLEKMSLSMQMIDPLPGEADPEIDDPFSRMEKSYRDLFSENESLINQDMQIERRIEEAVERLQLTIDPISGRYIGFDLDIPDDEELW